MKYPYSSYSAALPGYGTSLVDRINIYLHFRRYLKIITDRWLLLLVTTVTGTAAGCWVAFTKPYMYRSYSKLILEQKMRVTQSTGTDMTGESGAKFIDQQLALMAGRDLQNKVQTKLAESSGGTNRLVTVDAKPTPSTAGTFILSVTSINLEYARLYSIAWAEEFIETKRQQYRANMSVAESEAGRLQRDNIKRLDNAVDTLNDFKKLHNFVIGDDTTRDEAELTKLSNRKTDLETQLALLKNHNAEELAANAAGSKGTSEKSGSRSQANSDQDDAKSEFFAPGSRYADQKIRLNQLVRQRDRYTNVLRPDHPFMRQLENDVEIGRKDIESTLEIIEAARKGQIKGLELELVRLEPRVQQLREDVKESQQTRQDYLQLQQDEARLRDQLNKLNEQLANFRNSHGSEDDGFRIFESGIADDKPVSPNKPDIIGCGVGGGMLIGIAIMYLLHRLDDRLENPEAIEEALEEPIMGQLPEVDKRHYKEGYLLLTRMKSHTMFAESLRGVRSALLLSPEGSSKRFIAITSAVPGDGKTTFTANFAITLANSGNRTLLVDSDLRRGNIHGYFDQPLEGGLAEVLQGKLPLAEALRDTGIPNLFFLRAGERPSNPSELLLADKTRDLIRDLRAEFDYVIFDCPPLTAIDDTFSIAAYLDGLFFVIRAGRTSMRFAKMGINTIRQRGTPILGLIVNGVPIDNPYYYYTTYYYASYYHRATKAEEPAAGGRRIANPKAPALPPGMQHLADRAEFPPTGIGSKLLNGGNTPNGSNGGNGANGSHGNGGSSEQDKPVVPPGGSDI